MQCSITLLNVQLFRLAQNCVHALLIILCVPYTSVWHGGVMVRTLDLHSGRYLKVEWLGLKPTR